MTIARSRQIRAVDTVCLSNPLGNNLGNRADGF